MRTHHARALARTPAEGLASVVTCIVASAVGASGCSEPSAAGTSGTGSAASSVAAEVAPPAAPTITRRWTPQSRVHPGAFVATDAEDFAGVMSRDDGKLELFVVDGESGRIAWSRIVEGKVAEDRPLPLTVAGRVLAWASDGASEIHVVDPATGDEVRVVALEPGRTVTRMCAHTNRPTVTIPQPSGYDALVSLEDGREHNNSGLRRGPACTWAPPDRDVPKWVRERLPADLVIGDEPAYAYEPGRVVARKKEGRPDPILLGLGPAGNTLWQTRLGAELPTPPRVVDVRPVREGFTFAVIADGAYDESFLFGVDIETGKLRWNQRMLCHARWLQTTETRVYVASEDGRLHAWRSDGSILGQWGDGSPCPRAPALPTPAASSAK